MIALTRSIALGAAAALGLGAGLAGLSPRGDARSAQAPVDPPTAAPNASPPAESRQDGPEPSPINLVDHQAPPARDGGGAVDPAPSPPGDDAVHARSEVAGQQPILRLAAEEGAMVAEGQVVAELDASGIEDQLATQRITTERARADYQDAVKSREVALLDLALYREGTYPQELDAARGEVELAKAELELAHARLKRMEPLSRTGAVEALEVEKARVEVLRAELNLRKALKALEVLEEFAHDPRVKGLEAVVERAGADELVKKSRLEREEEIGEGLRRSIERCKVHAPASGVVRFPLGIREGGTVRERQLLFWIEQPPVAGDDPTPAGGPGI